MMGLYKKESIRKAIDDPCALPADLSVSGRLKPLESVHGDQRFRLCACKLPYARTPNSRRRADLSLRRASRKRERTTVEGMPRRFDISRMVNPWKS
jgi:hypothetical protein